MGNEKGVSQKLQWREVSKDSYWPTDKKKPDRAECKIGFWINEQAGARAHTPVSWTRYEPSEAGFASVLLRRQAMRPCSQLP